MILVEAAVQARGSGLKTTDFVVSDAAGDFFSDPANHYGPAICGYRVRYPADAVQAMSGAYLIAFGKRTLKAPQSRSTLAAAARYPTIVAIQFASDLDAWVETPTRSRSGFVGGDPVEGLDGAAVYSLRSTPIDLVGPEAPEGSQPVRRSIVLDNPGPGLKLRARSATRRRATLQVSVYRGGKIIERRTVQARLVRGTTTVLRVPSVKGGATSTRPTLTLSATAAGPGRLNVRGKAPFAGMIVFAVTDAGGAAVGFGSARVARAGAFTAPVVLLPTAAGRLTVKATLSGAGGRGATGATQVTVP